MKEQFNIKGRVAVCTGASSGIGRQMAETLSFYGAKVFLVGRRENKLSEVLTKINKLALYKGAIFSGDLLNRNIIPEINEACCAILGAPDILVNAAGVNFREQWNDINTETWDETIRLNLSIPFFLAQKVVPKMIEKKWGRIINIASLQSYRAFPNGLAYGASKGGIAQVTRGMAEAWSCYGITANAIAPGFFPTELTAPIFNDDEKKLHNAKMTAIGRNGEMRDLDGITVFLASEASDYITGQIINVDGGYTAK
jgi:gluconate 5-dehydrogenase